MYILFSIWTRLLDGVIFDVLNFLIIVKRRLLLWHFEHSTICVSVKVDFSMINKTGVKIFTCLCVCSFLLSEDSRLPPLQMLLDNRSHCRHDCNLTKIRIALTTVIWQKAASPTWVYLLRSLKIRVCPKYFDKRLHRHVIVIRQKVASPVDFLSCSLHLSKVIWQKASS